jgi:hypothetical protein
VAELFTRVTLFVPGVPSSAAAWYEALQRGGLSVENGVLRGEGLDAPPEVEWIENDGAFGQAFSFGTVGRGVIEAVEAAPGALVLHWPTDLRDGRQTIVAAVERLRDAGAIAVRLEQSKLGWDVSRWLELFSSINAWDWHRGAVTLLDGDAVLQSCGMHAFSLPDVQVRLDGDQFPLAELASSLNVYQLAEDPILRSGQTFTPARDIPRRVVERWPDTRYPAGHACHNPYGVWRLGPPGGSARKLQELVFTFIPALQVLLTAIEEKRGKPLTKKDVEATRDQGACIAMEPRDAQKLERERGYSDLDPELAWEQWRLVRPQARTDIEQ